MLIKDLIRKRSKAGDVGIEIEIEADAVLPSSDETLQKPWAAKPDGSLRGNAGAKSSMEYYTQGPIPVNREKLARIKRLTDVLSDKKYKVNADSKRTSVHVHVNCLELRPVQVWTAVVGYWLFEDAFMSYCGPDRVGCMYCLRLRDAEAVTKDAVEDIRAALPIIGLAGRDRVRYCGQNLMALPTFGTLEYRSMRGTIDPEVIDNWSTMVYNVVHYSANRFSSPADLMDSYWKNGADWVFSRLTDPDHCNMLKRLCKNWEELAEENATNLFELAYATDWDAWTRIRTEVFTSNKKNLVKHEARLLDW